MYQRVLTSKADLLPEIAPWEGDDGIAADDQKVSAIMVHAIAALAGVAAGVAGYLAFILMWPA
jgi:hypothetical protein